MCSSTIVEKTEMWFTFIHNWTGLCLPFRHELLFWVMKNQYKIAVACNVSMLLISLAASVRVRRLAGLVSTLLLMWILFSSFKFDIHFGTIEKLESQEYQDVLYVIAIIGGLHV